MRWPEQSLADLALSDLSGTTAVVLDVDGTIAGRDHRVSPRTRAAMAGIEQQGVPVVLATGRTRANVLEIARAAGLRTPQVSCNGAVVTDPRTGQDVWVRAMDAADAAAMARVHRETGHAFTWWTARTVFATHESLRGALLDFGAPAVTLAEAPSPMPDGLVKTMLHGSPAEMDAVAPRLRRLTPRATRSMDEMWEMSAADATKWAGVASVLDLVGADPATTLGLGDGENDVVRMTRIGLPVAMGNARPEALAVARAVTGHHADEGAADVLDEVLRQLRRRAA